MKRKNNVNWGTIQLLHKSHDNRLLGDNPAGGKFWTGDLQYATYISPTIYYPCGFPWRLWWDKIFFGGEIITGYLMDPEDTIGRARLHEYEYFWLAPINDTPHSTESLLSFSPMDMLWLTVKDSTSVN